MFQSVHLQVGGGHEVQGVDLGDDFLDESQIVRAGRDHERVASDIHGNGHGIPACLARNLDVGTARSVHALLNQTLEHRGDPLSVGMLEDEGFQHAFSNGGLHVDAGEEVADEVEVLFVGRDN